ncbi:5-(carboxyamino)imidazole ribonucleotide synthase [Alteromonadaceae bacterium BrNp21-10]|nr:5-(carboxyamino)imidazole ribonucleotide synthase [Alteromonadaceae bacterium BrNp21-10]
MNVLVLGAGQLARMMCLAGTPVGFNVCAFDVRSNKVVHPITLTSVHDNLASAIEHVDVITAEFEHIPSDILKICSDSGKFLPASQAIKAGGDRRIEKALLESANAANAKFHVIQDRQDFDKAISIIGLPLVLKSALEGYDGKGQWRLKSQQQADDVWQDIQTFLAESRPEQGIVSEQFVQFDREVSLIGARNARGEIQYYPLAENVHVDGVLSLSLVTKVEPALQQQAEDMFARIANELDYIGVLAIEFFDVNGTLLVNEIAPRVHNSGHWSQQGADTCQFENHLRAVCNKPLGNANLIRPTAMINILGEDQLPEALLQIPSLHIHWYGKDKRAGRKMGHINVCGESEQQLTQRLQQIAKLLDISKFPALERYL